ncbi:calcium-binding protein [Acuticoccus mangrovi]|uniref:Uncharacterized protein n=1 Tax=Acuticoccus mangrovi TaxID=2796142 RepID=A0A934MFH2_9HYPH|nr:calcium-binding protein [Acuticoccus mangrovi]MBJ3775468.1 hypothetical protein [Acuticoccus mangrovi]
MGRAVKFFKKVGDFFENQFNPIQHGDSGDNTMNGRNLAYNKLYGKEGDDTLKAFGARNVLYGGDGDDYLRAVGASNLLDGGEGNDRILGLGLHNRMRGEEGNDSLDGIGAYNDMDGGIGDDVLRGLGAYNRMKAGDGADQLVGVGAYNAMDGGAGNDHLIGVGAYNRMNGGDGDDQIEAIGAANRVDGGKGSDRIIGIGGVNLLAGGAGADTIIGVGGVNTVDGGSDDDVLVAVGGVNVMDGGAGDDIMIAAGVASKMKGGAGEDLMVAVSIENWQEGGDGDDRMFALGGANQQFGGAGDDTIVGIGGGNVQFGGSGDDMLFGLATAVNLQYGDDGDDIMVALGNLNVQIGGSGDDIAFGLGSYNVQLGGSGADILVALGSLNLQHGGSGDDVLVGLGSLNVQVGSNGHDILIGAGNGNIQFGGTLVADLPNDVAIAGLEVQLPGDEVMDLYNEHVGTISPDTDQNILVAGGQFNLQVGGSGTDIAVGVGKGNLQLLGAGDDIAVSGGKANLQLGMEGEDFMLTLQANKGLGGTMQSGGEGDDLMVAYLQRMKDGAPIGVQFGDSGNDVMAMLSSDFRYDELTDYGKLGTAAKALFIDGSTIQFGGDGEDTIISMVADFAVRSGGAGDDLFLNLGEGGFGIGGDGDDFMVSGVVPSSLYDGGSGVDVMLDFASFMRIEFGFYGLVADFFDAVVAELVGEVNEPAGRLGAIGDAMGGITDTVTSLIPGIDDIAGLATEFLTTFDLPAGNTFLGGDDDDVFGIASDLTTAIGGAGDDTFIVHLDAVSETTITDIDVHDGVSPEIVKNALDLLDGLEGGQSQDSASSGGRDVVELRGDDELSVEDLEFQRDGANLIVTVNTSLPEAELAGTGPAPVIETGRQVSVITFEGMDLSATDADGRAEVLRIVGQTTIEIDLAAAFDAGLFDGAEEEAISFDAATLAPFITAGSADTRVADGTLLGDFVSEKTEALRDVFDDLAGRFVDFAHDVADAAEDIAEVVLPDQPDVDESGAELSDEEKEHVDEHSDPAGPGDGGGSASTIALEDRGDVALAAVNTIDILEAELTKTLALTNGNSLVLYGAEGHDGAKTINGQMLDAMGQKIGEEKVFVTEDVDLLKWDAVALGNNEFSILTDRDEMSEKAFVITVSGEVYNQADPKKGTNFYDEGARAVLDNGNYVEVTRGDYEVGSTGTVTVTLRDADGDKIEREKIGDSSDRNFQSAVVGLVGGGFAVAYNEEDSKDNDIRLHIFDENGHETKAGFLPAINVGDTNAHSEPALAALGDGSFVLIYNKDEGTDQIRGIRIGADGRKIGADFVVADAQSAHTSATTLEDGRVSISFVKTGGEVVNTVLTFELDFDGTAESDVFRGSVGDDVAEGGAGDDGLFGSAGDDALFGGEGEDYIDGGAGADTLNGGAGDDVLDGGAGDDVMTGGAGADIFAIAEDTSFDFGNDVIIDFEAGTDLIDLLQVDGISSIDDLGIEQVGADTVLTVGNATTAVAEGEESGEAERTNTITLKGVDAADLDDASFAHAGNTVGERGTLELSTTLSTVNLLKTYENPVVVAFVKTMNDKSMVEARVSNVTADSFDIALQEPDDYDGEHDVETVSYMVLEAGRHVLSNGSVIEAGTIDTDAHYHTRQKGEFASVEFDGDLSGADTRVFASVNSQNGNDFVTTRMTNVTAEGFEIAMAEQEANTDGHKVETIGYIAFQDGDFGDFVTGGLRLDEDREELDAPIDFAQINGMGGSDTANVRQDLEDREIFVQEEKSHDSGTNHPYDDVAFINFHQDDGLFLV